MKELITIGKNIARQRKKNHLTQEDLCGLAEIDRSFLSELENGKINVSIKTLIQIAEALQVDLINLL